MKRILKEPLVHFLVLGALLFAGYGLLNRGRAGAPEPGRIVVSQGQLASMLETFKRTRQRPPTREEWRDLIRARVRAEVYYREALALGLDKDDTIIRRRLEQKMEFVSDDVAAQASPTDTDLNEYLKTHPDKFRLEPQFTFRQLYLNPENHGENLSRDAAELLAKLNQPGGNVEVSALGDSFILGRNFTGVPAGEIVKQFGQDFTTKLVGLRPGQWQGPIESSFGIHLVFISERTEGRLPALGDVRDTVSREWGNTRRLEANERFYQELLKHYTVTVEQPAIETEKKMAAAR